MDLDLLDMKVPGVVLVMSEADPLVVSDDLLVETEDGLIPGLIRNISILSLLFNFIPRRLSGN